MQRQSARRLALSLTALSLVACATDSPSILPLPQDTAGTSGVGGSAMTGGTAGAMTGGTGGAATAGGAGGTPAAGASGVTGLGGSAGAGGSGASGSGGTAGALGGGAGSGAGVGGSAAGASGSDAVGGAGIGGAPNAGEGGSIGGASAGTSAGAPPSGGAAGAGGGTSRPARVLLYSFSTLDIPSVPAQLTILEGKLTGWQYTVDKSKDPAVFTDNNLARYAAVGMINTCFSPFGSGRSGQPESEALQRFLQAGGGLFGTHCADVTFQSANPPALYNQLIGGRAGSTNYEGMNACRTEGSHPTIAGLSATFQYSGNLDATDFMAMDSTVLVRCKFGGGSQTDTAVSWIRNEGAGRVFYSNFGKVDADLSSSTIGDAHLIAGLAWVLGR